ncbi:sensor histidine kinase [Thiohalorhabdus sp. Cl-TMA]|uniref:histidine kinase n=1 Tax=Thiohalorhabdus methylotrophus TaxID=3242694 RepID=A0ABV4TV23_9GAMM
MRREGKAVSLRRRLLIHEMTLLFLLLVTAGLGGAWLYLWQGFSVENWRLNALVNELHQARSGLYRQIQAVMATRFSPEEESAERLALANRQIEQWVDEIRGKARGPRELDAVRSLDSAWAAIHRDLREVVSNPYAIGPPGRLVLMNTERAERLLGAFESAVARFNRVLEEKKTALESRMRSYNLWIAWGTPLPLLLAVGLVVRSRSRVKAEFLQPVASIRQGTRKFSEGELEHRIPVRGVEEMADLANAFNIMAEELLESRRALLEQERAAALGGLVPVIGHNIRNPLASIRATAQTLDPEDEPRDLEESRQAILDTVDRLEQWLHSLVAYLHPSEPDLEVRPLAEVIGHAVEVCQSKAREQGVSLQTHTVPENLTVKVDTGLMEQALYGLLVNAVEASPRGGTVSVQASRAGGSFAIRIEDQGPGLSFLPEPSETGPGPSTKPSGTGLGIPFAFKVCEAHGWALHFQNIENGGARAVITGPRAG